MTSDLSSSRGAVSRSAITALLDAVLVLLFAVLVVDVLWQVASRYLLSSPSPWTEEAARFLLIWLGLLGGCRAALLGLHTAVTTVRDRLPPRLDGYAGRLVAVAVTVFALGVLVLGGGNLVRITLQLGQRSAALGLPLGIVYSVLPISGLLLTLAAWTTPSELPVAGAPDREPSTEVDGSVER